MKELKGLLAELTEQRDAALADYERTHKWSMHGQKLYGKYEGLKDAVEECENALMKLKNE
jgi:hypothetical protein